MNKTKASTLHDFEATISVVDGEFDISATGDIADIVQGLILAVATLMEAVKKNTVPDAMVEDAVMGEYRRAVEFIKEHGTDCEVSLK